MGTVILPVLCGLIACLLSFSIGRQYLIVSPRYRLFRKWQANGGPNHVSLDEAQQFRAWKELGRPVTGSGANLYRAIVADRDQMKARIRDLETLDGNWASFRPDLTVRA